VFKAFGDIATVDSDLAPPKGTVFKVLFNVSDAATPGAMSKKIETAARFINMHVEAGVPIENIHIAIVVHGPAGDDLLKPEAYAARHKGIANGNIAVIEALLAHKVQIWMCAQSAAATGIARADLLPGVKMTLSAMTADALLQQQGYTLNPF
jgi:intracellular sulfur oxidation DsrE/DsrF family protein